MSHLARSFGPIDRLPLSGLILVITTVSALCLSGCSTSIYLAKLGCGQAKILLHSRPNETVLNDPTVEESVKEKIRLIMEAKIYGEEQIGLAETSNFLRFYRVKGPSLLYVVSASPKDRLEPYQWWFPVTGRVTAKGFFSDKDAFREAEKLERKGLDVFVQGAQAYSTLGWFKDPILSTMLQQDPATVVNVVIHELTHATVFFKDQLDFNEQIATFVGGQGAIDFAEAKFGAGSPFGVRAVALLEDGVLFAGFMREVYQKLRQLYSQPVPFAVKLREREAVFRQAKLEFKALKGQFRTDSYQGFEEIELNNAVILALGRYVTDIEQIQSVYEKFDRDLGRTVTFLAIMRRRGIKNPQDYIAKWLREGDSGESISLRPDVPVGVSMTPGAEKLVELGLVVFREVDK